MKKLYVYSFGIVAFMMAASSAMAQAIPTLDLFHGAECPHCQAEIRWLPTLQQAYPDLVVNKYEVWHDTDNQQLWSERLAEFNMTPSAVPTNIIGDEVIVGFQQEAILAALEARFGPPAVDISMVEAESDYGSGNWMTLLIALGGAAVLVGGLLFFTRKS